MSHKISSFSCLLAHLVSHALSASIKDSVHHRHAIPFLLSWSSSASYPLFPPLILASLTAWSKIAFGRDFLTSFLTVFGYRSSSRFLLLEIKVCPLVLRRWDHKLLSRKRKRRTCLTNGWRKMSKDMICKESMRDASSSFLPKNEWILSDALKVTLESLFANKHKRITFSRRQKKSLKTTQKYFEEDFSKCLCICKETRREQKVYLQWKQMCKHRQTHPKQHSNFLCEN